MPLRVNDNDPVRQKALEELLGPYIPPTRRVSMIQGELTQYDAARGCHKSVVANQIHHYLATDMVIVYGETPFKQIADADWYQRYNRHPNFRYIALGELSFRVCAIAALIQLFYAVDDPADKENISTGIERYSHPS